MSDHHHSNDAPEPNPVDELLGAAEILAHEGRPLLPAVNRVFKWLEIGYELTREQKAEVSRISLLASSKCSEWDTNIQRVTS